MRDLRLLNKTIRNHVDRLTEEMFGYDPLDHYEDYFNVHIINLVSEESGIDNPPDVMVDTALDAGNSFDEFHERKITGIDVPLANLEFSTSENFGMDPDIKIVMVKDWWRCSRGHRRRIARCWSFTT